MSVWFQDVLRMPRLSYAFGIFRMNWPQLGPFQDFQGYVVKEEDLWSTSLKVSESWLNSKWRGITVILAAGLTSCECLWHPQKHALYDPG